MHFTAVTIAALAFAPSALAHGYVSKWGVKGGTLENGQKQSLKSTAFRGVSDNTGWIGSKFLTNGAIACGSSNTPFNTVAAPGGTLFSAAAQSAGKELAVKAGDTVEFVISGNKGEGWPHKKGIVQTYLGSCDGDCTNFDASQAQFFKIQEEVDGIQNTLIPAYDSSLDGNRYDVAIPDDVEAGSYIMRLELIAFGQSSGAEGNQDQYYPFCGQIKVGGGSAKRSSLSRRASANTVSFPGAYKNGNLQDQETAPGPTVSNAVSGTVSSDSGNSTSTSTSSSSSKSSTSSKASNATSASSSSSSGALSLASSAPSCASMCLNVKMSELSSLAPSCDSSDASCMCGTSNFMTAFANCAADNCNGDEQSAVDALNDACGSGSSKRSVQNKRRAKTTKNRQSARSATVKRVQGVHKMRKIRRTTAGHGAAVVGFSNRKH